MHRLLIGLLAIVATTSSLDAGAVAPPPAQESPRAAIGDTPGSRAGTSHTPSGHMSESGMSKGVPNGVPNGVPTGVLDAQCDRCHRFARELTHPVAVPAPAGMTKLPLESGRVVCITCHDDRTLQPHGTSGPRHTASPSNDPMLRTDSVDTLCSTCHEGGLRGSSVHATGLMRAHLEGADRSGPAGGSRHAGQQGSRSGARAALGSERFDAESAACLNCHDGSVASDVGNHVESMHRSGSGGMRGMDGPSSHPIGVLYKATSSRDAIELRSPGSLDQRIRLFDQRVGCGSCHSIYSGHQKDLVFPNDRSVLCLSCHRM